MSNKRNTMLTNAAFFAVLLRCPDNSVDLFKFEVEDDEPDDVSSEAFARWEQRRDLLEEKIACVEEQIDELEW